MKHYNRTDIQNLEKHFKINLINSLSGIRPACLIGTISATGKTNVAIFNSVMHIGADPALIGFFMRPVTVERHTHANIKATGCFTINHFHPQDTRKAHHTSAKFESDVSEFEACGLTPAFLDGFQAPFVSASPLRIGARFVEQVPIKSNGTSLIIGEIEHVMVDEIGVLIGGHLDMEQLDVVGVSGLDTYYRAERLATFLPARPDQAPVEDQAAS